MAELLSDLLRTTLFTWQQRRWYPGAFTGLGRLQRADVRDAGYWQDLQQRRLAGMQQHAAANVPYYREILGGKQPTALADFPILTKETLRTRGHALLADGVNKSRLTLNASGGSTGKPVQLYQDANYWQEARASQWFVESWWGIRPGDRTASIWGTDRDLPPQTVREKITAFIAQLRVCNAFALDEQRMEAFAEMLAAWQPRFVIGYSSALSLFARFLLERPHLAIRPVAMKSTAEVLHASERAVIEQAFQAPLYDFYGSREVNNIAAQCEQRRGLHVNTWNRVVEIVDEKGAPVAPGRPGRVLVTDLTNFAMPMIRYENEDVSSLDPEPCACGRAFPTLSRIEGRKSDFILTPARRLIHGEYFTHLFYDQPQVRTFRVHQESLERVVVEMVLADPGAAPDFSALRAKIQEPLGAGVEVAMKVVPAIARPESGKHRFTTSDVVVPWGEAAAMVKAEEKP